MNNGYFRIERGWDDHPLFQNDKAGHNRRTAWVWLVEHAQFAERVHIIGGLRIKVKVGQLAVSIRYLAAAWKWDVAKVSRYLKALQRAQMIETSTESGITVITVCNYERPGEARDQYETVVATPAPQRESADADKSKESPLRGVTTKKETRGRDVVSEAELAFSGKVIRLNEGDFSGWRKAYSKIPDLAAELTTIDAYLVNKGIRNNWFLHVSRMLQNKHDKILSEQRTGERSSDGIN